jgi:hypothetical protein
VSITRTHAFSCRPLKLLHPKKCVECTSLSWGSVHTDHQRVPTMFSDIPLHTHAHHRSALTRAACRHALPHPTHPLRPPLRCTRRVMQLISIQRARRDRMKSTTFQTGRLSGRSALAPRPRLSLGPDRVAHPRFSQCTELILRIDSTEQCWSQ